MTVLDSFEPETSKRHFEVRAHEVDTRGGVSWQVRADSPLEAVQMVLAGSNTESLNSPIQQLRQLGQDLLEIAGVTGMPLDVFARDERIARACAAMGLSVSQGWEWVSRL